MAKRPPTADDPATRIEDEARESAPRAPLRKAAKGLSRRRAVEADYRVQLKLRYGGLWPEGDRNLSGAYSQIEGYPIAASFDRQKDRESLQVQQGIERYRKSAASLTENPSARASQADTEPGRRLMIELLDALIPQIEELQDQAIDRMQGKGGTELSKAAIVALLSLKPAPLALITARTAFTTIRLLSGSHEGGGRRQEERRAALSAAVGRYVLQEKKLERCRNEETAAQGVDIEMVNFVERMKLRTVKPRPRQVESWRKRAAQIGGLTWGPAIREKVGEELLACLVLCGDWFEQEKVKSHWGHYKTEWQVRPASNTVKRLNAAHGKCELLRPWLSPMLCPPKDWCWDESANRYRGGYLFTDQPLIKWTPHGHTSDSGKPASTLVLDAVNAIQATPWRINRHIFGVIQEAWDRGLEIAGLPQLEDVPLPDDFPDAQWKTMSEEGQKRHRRQRREIHSENDRLSAKRSSLMRTLEVAEELVDEPAIWFPHNLDFRGRCYPLPQDLQPQGDDFARSLLIFAEGKPLDEGGIFWLKNYLASLFGAPWKKFEDRIEWVNEHTSQIRAAVDDPLDNDWWCHPEHGADKPWQFLAAAHEWVCSEDNPEFVSSFPVHIDGSNNGLQHLAALGRDAGLGKYTNITPSEIRQDLYQEVADRVLIRIEAEARKGNDIANRWIGKITRKTVKRPVMTTPYGVTKRSMRMQLIEGGYTKGLEGEPGENAGYLCNILKGSIDETIGSARQTMEWLQAVAKKLGALNQPLVWTAPTGMRIRQAYNRDARKRIKTALFGDEKISSRANEIDQNIDTARQVNGVVPNFIHSLDAAHMMATVVAAREAFGVRNFSMIHDSFGVLAADQPALNAVIREEFIALYSGYVELTRS